MANSNKSIVITPNTGSTTADPKIVFSGADASTAAQNITMTVYPANNGTLSIDGSAGQLFSVSNSLTGTLFSVNDISGVPSIEVLDTGAVKIAQYNGSVAIGTGSPDAKLHVNANTSTVTAGPGTPLVHLSQADANGVGIVLDTYGAAPSILTRRSQGTSAAKTAVTADVNLLVLDGYGYGTTGYSSVGRGGFRVLTSEGWTDTAQGTYIVLNTTAAGTTTTAEKMRVDSSGNVLVGATTSTPASGITIMPGTGLNSNIGVHHASGAPSGNFYVGFNYNSTNIGGITQNGTTSVSYNTTSDARRKQNIVDAPSAIQKVNGIQVRSFDWISGGAHVEHGLVAQELQTVAPEAVHVGGADAAVAPWAVDQSRLVPTLVKALQEALAEIEALKARLTAANI
jgi:hypothetical protein